ncbi:MAG: FG-GAP-like repeat-containing protein, partial [bacterium]|nr:FG-GAP-like repeat-containing protein [bacterium]
MDLVAATSNGVYVWLQQLEWICPAEAWVWGFNSTAITVVGGLAYNNVSIGDIDDDGDLDIVASSATGWRSFLNNGGGSSWSLKSTVAAAVTWTGLELADIDNDGDLDVFATYLTGNPRSYTNDGTGVFTLEVSVTALKATALDFKDINKDGSLDVVFSTVETADGADDGKIFVYNRNSTNNGWTSKTRPENNPDINAAANWQGVRIADLNRDGNIDIVAVAGQDDGNNSLGEQAGVYVYYGLSDGTWRNPSTLIHPATTDTYLTVKLSDLNNDGFLDVVAGQYGGGILAWLGSEEEVWIPITSPVNTGVYNAVTLFDYDNDGNLDVAGASASGSIVIRRQSGSTNDIGWKDFDYPVGAGGFQGVASADFNNDGNPDVVAASNEAGVRVWYGDGNSSWKKSFAIYSGFAGIGNGTLDVDNIITTDAKTLTESWTITVTTANGDTPTFQVTHGGVTESALYTLPGTYTEPDTGVSFTIYDGTVDFVAGATFTFRTTKSGITTSGIYYGVTAADFNNDGNMDVAAASNSGGGVNIWYGNGAGEWNQQPTENIGSGNYYYVTGVDVDNDGDVDLVAGSDNDVTVWKNLSTTFTGASTIQLGATSYSGVATADFDKDGWLDIAAASQLGSRIHVWRGDGAGGFLNLTSDYADGRNHTGPRQPIMEILGMKYEYDGIAVADFDRDGNLDIVAGNSGGWGVHVWYGDGDGEGDGVINWRLSYATPAGNNCEDPGVGHLSSTPYGIYSSKGWQYEGYWGLDAIIPGIPTPVRVGVDTNGYATTNADWTFESKQPSVNAPGDFTVTSTDGSFEDEEAYASSRVPSSGSGPVSFSGLGTGSMTVNFTTPALTVDETWIIRAITGGINPEFEVRHGTITEAVTYLPLPGNNYYEPDRGVDFTITAFSNISVGDQFTFNTTGSTLHTYPPSSYFGDSVVPNVNFIFNGYSAGYGTFHSWYTDGFHNTVIDDHNEKGYFSTYYPGVVTDGTYYGVATGDFNNDGYPDIVSANKGNAGVRIWLNGGENVWLRSHASAEGPISEVWTEVAQPVSFGNYNGVAVLDFNKDGLPDIVSAHDITSGVGVEVWLNTQDPYPPTVDTASLVPAIYEVGVDPSSTITFKFSENINPLTLRNLDVDGSPSTDVSTTVAVYGTSSRYHSGVINYNSLDFTASFTPDTAFSSEESVTVTLMENIKDLAGNKLDGNEDGVAGDRYDWTFTIKDTDKPLPPTSVNGIAGESLVLLSWTPPTKNANGSALTDLAGYNVYVKLSTSPSYPTTPRNGSLIPAGQETYSVTGLANGTTYNLIVRAIDTSDNESINSSSVVATPAIDTIAPSSPTSLISRDGDLQVDLSWTAPTTNSDSSTLIDLAGYNLYRATNQTTLKADAPAFTNISVVSNAGISAGSILFFGPNASSEQEMAEVLSVSGADSITLTAPLQYNYLVGDKVIGPLGKVNQALIPVGTEFYTDKPVVNGSTYYYTATAVDTSVNANESAPSNLITSNPDEDNVAPAAPTMLNPTNGDNAIFLIWSSAFKNETGVGPVVDFNSYKIYRNTVSFAGYSTFNIYSSGASLVKTMTNISSTSWQDTVSNGLEYGTTYYYRMTATDIYDNETKFPSNEVTGSPVNPVAIIMLTATDYAIPADGSSQTVITAYANNAFGNPVVDGTIIDFSLACAPAADCGALSQVAETTVDGQASVTLTSGIVRTDTVTVTGSSGPISGTATLAYKPGPPVSLTISASPEAIAADGVSTSVVTASVEDSAGDPVKDGLLVQFTTDLGKFSNGSKTSNVIQTVGGDAKVALTAAAVGGTPWIHAKIGFLNISGTPLQFTAKPAFINITAIPSTIAADGLATSSIVATVTDAGTNPIPEGVVVDFTTTSGILASPFASITGLNGNAVVSLTSEASNGSGDVKAYWTNGFDTISSQPFTVTF